MAGKDVPHDPSTLTEYGLGYGVDVTALNERRDIVRQAFDAKKKQEQGAFEYYYRVSQSGREVSLKSSTTLAANLLTAGVGGGLSRGTFQVSVEVGCRIHTRTYDFSKDTYQDFEDTLREKVKFNELRNSEDALLEKCKSYLERDLKCTHYVKSIMMGAAEYEVMSLEEYNSTFSFLGSIGAKMQDFGFVASSQFGTEVKKRHKELEYTKVGSWNKSYRVLEEKVIDVKIAPIHELIKTNRLKNAFKKAVVKYRKERINEVFYIKCGTHETYYLKEEKDGSGMITATTEVSEAKKFCISNTKNSNVIAIETFEETGPTKRLTYSVSRFSGKGRTDSPPVLRENSDTYTQRLTLKHPREQKGNMVNPNLWISEESMYLYIRCYQFGRKGKFCIQKINEVFKLTIVPKSEVHNGKDVLMLFCLQKVESNDS